MVGGRQWASTTVPTTTPIAHFARYRQRPGTTNAYAIPISVTCQ